MGVMYHREDGAANDEERSEGCQEKSQSPVPDEPNDETTEKGGDPLDEQSCLVSYTVVDLLYVAAQKAGHVCIMIDH